MERYWSIMYTSLNQVLLLHHIFSKKLHERRSATGIYLLKFYFTFKWNTACLPTINYTLKCWLCRYSFSKLFFRNLKFRFGCSYSAMEILRICLPSAMVVNAFLCTGVSFNELLSVHLPLENPLVALLDLSHFIELLYKTNCSAWVLFSLKRDRTPSRSEICLRLLSKSDLLFPCELLELV